MNLFLAPDKRLNHRVMPMETLVYWLTLKNIPGIGNRMFNRLVQFFGSPRKALKASDDKLIRVKGMTRPLLTAMADHQSAMDWANREIERITQKGYHIITLNNPHYPELLRHIVDPPPYLYCQGTVQKQDCFIAVVGSRKATAYGLTSAKSLSKDLAERGICVVSGMARGIDTAAHLGALEGNGRTVAVLGSGLDCVYPPENLKLFNRIAQHGAILTEFPLKTEPMPHNFPKRNRIISGMAYGTVVVEAANRSGSLITAKLAAEQGREVYAVPGSIHAANAHGTHDLIKQGAKLVENAWDVIEEITPQLPTAIIERNPAKKNNAKPAPTADTFTENEILLLKTIGPYPVHIDELARRCQRTIGRLSADLFQLELKGAVCQEPGKFFHAKPLENINRVK